MQVFFEIKTLQAYLKNQRKSGKTIGFVPTMGALHQGHLSLIETAKNQNDVVVCSIFVNPTQFNNPHDLAVYPRTLEADCKMLEEVACDIVFAPSASEMYPSLPTLKFDFGTLENVMEGKFRPGHFNGVGIVVSKLFNIVQPNKAYFGQKDLQQCAVINCLVKDLSFSLDLVICPTQRETDGLAMSSRNRNLSEDQRVIAPEIYKSLSAAAELLKTKSSTEVKQFVTDYFEVIEDVELEYFEISDFETLLPIEELLEGKTALCIAAFLGKTRLIDNIII
ncbi:MULTISPECIES: pantoate--beta-alanine ligase [unclassified Arcicella]|uniref:pantoate--beta-alanine ligase n=1 Tax=unclassified Arcicella TaxID=2644986 RepID=UPI002866BE99|nr:MULTISPECIES: pantoate--beta-alanine ligase [unclassified Arcicella]MDR6562702.1 pantoate--beta-alanine ligase [Arcicella sp. BE51]MDR6812953.1 pantoate--beta-alanine ligase [Arcicella sp. BE140]MDR6824267.1 pantoate--beta-alanine ligase [Arcicella sp. BE139]